MADDTWDDSFSATTTLESAARAAVRATRWLVRSAFLVGLVTVFASAGVAYMAYAANRDSVLQNVSDQNLQLATAAANYAARALPATRTLDERRMIFLGNIERFWQSLSNPERNGLTVLNERAEILMSSIGRELKGNSAADVRLLGTAPPDGFAQLVAQRREWAGQAPTFLGADQLVGCYFEEDVGALVVIHRPVATMTSKLQATALPWGIGIMMIVLGLVPLALALLYRSYRVTQDAGFAALAAHRQSEDRYRDLYNKTPVMMHSVDADGFVVSVNGHWLKTLGYKRREVLGRPASSYMTPSAREHAEKAVMPKLRRRGSCQDVPLQLVTRDGRVLDVLMSASVERGENVEVRRIRSMLVDVSQLRRAEAEREKVIHALEEKNDELQSFTYTVSHDLKSPLVTVKGFIGYLEKDAREGNIERLNADIARINDAADKMKRLVDELLELSRIGRFVNPPENVDVSALAEEVAELLSGSLEERGVEVVIAPDMPKVFCDRGRLSQAFQNLLENAVKFMGEQEKPRIEVGWYRNDKVPGAPAEIVYFVQDNGGGIEERYLQKIFGLFEKMSAKSDGTGVGLALVRRIVEVHGGRIWAASDGLGKGATFHFTMPGKRPEV